MNQNTQIKRFAALEAAARERILLLDGAKGAMIQNFGLTETDYRGSRFATSTHDLKGNHDLLAITKPEVLREIHTAFLDAGSDIIQTNTFNAQRISQADYGCEHLAHEINVEAARIARACADQASSAARPRWVVGSVIYFYSIPSIWSYCVQPPWLFKNTIFCHDSFSIPIENR